MDQGYTIVVADYAGMGTPGSHSYLNGSVAAANVVDSLVASYSLLEGALSPSWAVIGQSQGGGTALHVAHEASALSQEAKLDYLGAVATGTPAYIKQIVNLSGTSCLAEVAESLEGTNISRMFSAPLMSVAGLPEALGAYMATPTGGYAKPVLGGPVHRTMMSVMRQSRAITSTCPIPRYGTRTCRSRTCGHWCLNTNRRGSIDSFIRPRSL